MQRVNSLAFRRSIRLAALLLIVVVALGPPGTTVAPSVASPVGLDMADCYPGFARKPVHLANGEGVLWWCDVPRAASTPTVLTVGLTLQHATKAGVAFYSNNASTDNVELIILVTGGYYVYRGREGTFTRTLAGYSPALRRGGHHNKLTMVIRGGDIALYFNDTYADTLHDTVVWPAPVVTFTPQTDEATEVIFTNVRAGPQTDTPAP